uniref:Uncharacterized protein n=1 Tax=Panagrolaimus sp. PS1159 TaxID=55785 RepID=A0AC35G5N6_9BILA
MVFLSLNVCNPTSKSAHGQNQNLRKPRLFKTLIQNCSCLDALIKSLTTMLSKMSQKTLLHLCFTNQPSKMDSNIPLFKMIVYGISVFYVCNPMFQNAKMFLNFFVMAQILNLNKNRLFKTFNQNCSCLDVPIKTFTNNSL